MKALRSSVLAALALLSVSCRTETKPKPRELTLQAVHIADGDTFEGRDGDQTHRIRLHGVDAPEKGQDFSKKSRETLGRLCKNGPLKAVIIQKDRFGRWVCDVYDRNGQSINKALVKEGMAWHFKRYSSDRELARLEAEARSARIGLWSLDDPIAPWIYRKDSTARERERSNGTY
jgi:endonuclease YncB( thermonuclease family)